MTDLVKAKERILKYTEVVTPIKQFIRPIQLEQFKQAYLTDLENLSTSKSIDYLLGSLDSTLFICYMLTSAIGPTLTDIPSSGFAHAMNSLSEGIALQMVICLDLLETELARVELTNQFSQEDQ